MTAAWAPHAPASASQAGPAGAVTDHSDCSGTAGIASIDNRLLTIGRRAADSTAGAADGQTSAPARAPDRVRLFRPVPMCETGAQSQRRKGAARPRYTARHGAPRRQAQRRVFGFAWGAPMRSPPLRCAATLCLMLSVLVHAAPPPLPAEHLSVQQLPPKSPHWVFVYDEAFDNEIDARVHLFDGDSYRRLGQIDAGFLPSVSLSPDGTTTAVATTYFARGSRGARTDVVEFTDNATLATTGEIVLPSKRAQTSPTIFNMGYRPDGHFLYA